MGADTPRGAKAAELAAELRERIYSGEWADGSLVPSQAELVKKSGLSTETVRAAIDELNWEGLVDKGQGRRSRVTHRDPGHRLLLGPHQLPAVRIAEPPIAFTPDPGAGTVERECAERVAPVPRGFAKLLGLPPDEPLVERAIRLTADGELVLTSTSYLPAELTVGRGPDWRDAEIGQLALTGHTVSVEFAEGRARMPTPTERDELGIPKGVPLKILSYPCRVLVDDRLVPAGVIVLARSDRVLLRWPLTP